MDGKRARFEAQVLPHLDAAYRLAMGLTRLAADAEDLVQEAVVRAYRGFDALRANEARPWLLTIVRNCYLTARSQQQRRVFVPLPDDEEGDTGEAPIAASPGPEAATITADRERALGRSLARLSEEHREILILREIEDMSYREIAAVTRLPIGTVMSRLARARLALKELWLADHRDETS
jgi:RNA polymerase sigma factor (sigma-70 family)